MVAILLAAFTQFGLTGLALVALALGVLFVAQEMPARTAAGTAILGGLDVLRGSLLTQPVDTLPAGQGYRAAVGDPALRHRHRWQGPLAAGRRATPTTTTSPTPPTWTGTTGRTGWQLADLPASLANFVTTVQGTLFSR